MSPALAANVKLQRSRLVQHSIETLCNNYMTIFANLAERLAGKENVLKMPNEWLLLF